MCMEILFGRQPYTHTYVRKQLVAIQEEGGKQIMKALVLLVILFGRFTSTHVLHKSTILSSASPRWISQDRFVKYIILRNILL